MRSKLFVITLEYEFMGINLPFTLAFSISSGSIFSKESLYTLVDKKYFGYKVTGPTRWWINFIGIGGFLIIYE